MMIASRLISFPSLQAIAESYVANRGNEESNRNRNENQILHASFLSLKLDQYGEVQTIFRLAQIRRKAFHNRSRRALIVSWRRHPPWPGEIRDIRGAMVIFPTERDVLARHVV